jgi:hypothetical protein
MSRFRHSRQRPWLLPYSIGDAESHNSHGMRRSGYPLQFFTTYYINQVNFELTGRKADEGGLFSAIGGQVSLWRHHFDLNSEGYEDQRS